MKLLPKTPIKYKGRTFGVVVDSDSLGGDQVYFAWHNGMKVRFNIASTCDLEVISLERFKAYITRSGYNSLFKYL